MFILLLKKNYGDETLNYIFKIFKICYKVTFDISNKIKFNTGILDKHIIKQFSAKKRNMFEEARQM